MKKIIALLLALCVLFSFAACNDDGPVEETTTEQPVTQAPVEGENDKYKYLEYSDHVELTVYKGQESYVSLPTHINGKPVTSFGKIFKESLTLVTLIIPGTYTEIEEEAFYNAWKLQYLTINSGSLKSIGANAFLGCQSLKTAAIPANVTEIHETAFKYCTGLIITGEAGSAIEEFASNFSSIYFRDKNSTTTVPETEPETVEEKSTEEVSETESSTSETTTVKEKKTEESSTNE